MRDPLNETIFGKSTWETMLGTCSRLYCGVGSMLSRWMSMSSRKSKVYRVAVEGNIGSGKTTLLRHFADDPNVEIILEPVEKWRNIKGHNALALMYEDPERWSMTLQTYVQLTMLEMHLKPSSKPVKMIERSIFSAKYCFVENLKESGKMADIDYVILTRWFEYITQNQDCDLDLIVYLRTKPETLARRIKERGRKEETPIPLAYLEKLHNLHEDWLVKKEKFTLPCPVLILDADEDVEHMKKVFSVNRHQIMGIESI